MSWIPWHFVFLQTILIRTIIFSKMKLESVSLIMPYLADSVREWFEFYQKQTRETLIHCLHHVRFLLPWKKNSVCSVFQAPLGQTQASDSHMTADAQSFFKNLLFCNSVSRTSSAAPTTARARWTNGRPASWSAASCSSSNRAKPTNTSVGWQNDDWGGMCVEKSNTLYSFLQWRVLSCRKPERASTRPTPATGTPAWTVGGSAPQRNSLTRSFIPNNSTPHSSER